MEAASTNSTNQRSWLQRHKVGLGLFALLSLALALRLYGINWDQGSLYHPDERAFLTQVNDLEFPDSSDLGSLLTRESPLHPGSFNWGSLPHYMLKTVQYAAAPFTELDLFELRYPGRTLSALADTVTVALVYFIGARWFSRRTGFLAAGMAAIAVLNIQLSHFFAVDTFMTTFIVAAVYFSVRVAYSGKTSDSVLAGVMAGLALATKFSVAPLAVPLLTGHLVYALSRPGETLDTAGWRSEESAARRVKAFKGLIAAAGAGLVSVIITQPYMFIDFTTFISNINEQGEMVRRIRDFPFTRQYVDTPKYWYQVWQLGFWGLGPAMGLATWLGLFAVAGFTWFSRRKVDIVLLAWVVPYLLLTGWFDVKFMRYMAPLVPFLVLYGARLLIWLGEILQAISPRRKYLAAVPAALVLILTAQYTLAFMNVYSGVHPANAASDWLKENAAPGSRVAQEHWEEGVRGVPGLEWVHERLGLYEPDTTQKFTSITSTLASADYLVFYSNRLYGTIPRLPERYPASTVYYQKLFDGSLGYELVYNNTRAVESLGITYYEDQFVRVPFGPPEGFDKPEGAVLTVAPGWADESFSVYEHPEVLVFQNTGRLSEFDMLREIGVSSAQLAPGVGLLLSEGDLETQQAGGTWTDVAFLSRLPEGVSWLVWLVAAEIIAVLTLPIAFIVFRPFPDRGYLLAKPLGLLLAGTITWLLASVEVLQFGFAGALVGVLFVAAMSALIFRTNRQEMLSFFRERKRLLLFAEALFLVAFLSFLAVRAANPDLWHPFRGGEKPMDFAYLNAVARSTVMPPYDPWFAGGYLNYYYFGQFLIADLIRLTGIAPAVAYNLAVPLLFAFTAGVAFSVVYSLTALTLLARSGAATLARAKSPVVAGVLAAVLVTVAGNIDGLVQLAEHAKRALVDSTAAGAFDFWRSSRMFEPGSPGNEITEFPFFSFLFADLHAHMIVIPFAMLAAALAITTFLQAGLRQGIFEQWGRLAVLGIGIGALRLINAWDFPTQLLLAGGAVLGGELILSRKPLSARIAAGLLKWIFVAAVGYLVYLPFHLNFELFNNGVLSSETQTPLWRYFAVHSVFLLAVLSWLFFELRGHMPAIRSGIREYAEATSMPLWIVPLVLVLASAAVLTFAFTVWGTLVFTLLIAGCALAAGVAGYHTRKPGARYMLVAAGLVVMAMALGGGVDLFTVKDDIGRMNTVFKFYLQAWWLLAIASAYFLWLLGASGHLSLRNLSPPKAVWMTALGVLAIGVMVYPVMGTQARIRDRFSTDSTGLDGLDYMQVATQFERASTGEFRPLSLQHDLKAIKWLQENVEGSPVIVEGITDLYRLGNRISINTGLPAVIGWDWHQRQQRVNYAWAVTQRRVEVNDFYRGTSLAEAVELMDLYNVRYVYVGELEKLIYPAAGLDKFASMSALGLSPVYDDGPVTIYEYTPARTVSRAQ